MDDIRLKSKTVLLFIQVPLGTLSCGIIFKNILGIRSALYSCIRAIEIVLMTNMVNLLNMLATS